MAHSNHIILKKKHHFSSLQLSDPELDEFENYPSDEEREDIPFDEVIHEDSPRRKNMPVETPMKENSGEQLPVERATAEDE